MTQKFLKISVPEKRSMYKLNRLEPLTSLAANICSLARPFFYSKVSLENKEILIDAMHSGTGALLIPNHIEYMDSVAIGTALYHECARAPYFVSKPQLRPHWFFKALGCIPYERGCDLKNAIMDIKLHQRGNLDEIITNRIRLNENRQSAAFDQFTSAINSGEIVVMYLQGHRKKDESTIITKNKYQNGLNNWLSGLGDNPKPVIPMNIHHHYQPVYSPKNKKNKKYKTHQKTNNRVAVTLTVFEPIDHTMGLELVTKHLAKYIDVFKLE
jgi:1-acyl-sn-glycerol-3-phosphate acyltransferase